MQVYDIEVEGTHNFVAQGIIAHNTFINNQKSETSNQPKEISVGSPAEGIKDVSFLAAEKKENESGSSPLAEDGRKEKRGLLGLKERTGNLNIFPELGDFSTDKISLVSSPINLAEASGNPQNPASELSISKKAQVLIAGISQLFRKKKEVVKENISRLIASEIASLLGLSEEELGGKSPAGLFREIIQDVNPESLNQHSKDFQTLFAADKELFSKLKEFAAELKKAKEGLEQKRGLEDKKRIGQILEYMIYKIKRLTEESSSSPVESSQSVSSPTEKQPLLGGIDLRALPFTIQPTHLHLI